MAEAAVMGMQSNEFARASVMYSDLELAYELQLNEALAASVAMTGIPSSSSSSSSSSRGRNEGSREQQQASNSTSTRGGDRAIAFAEQSGELRRRQQVLVDQGKAQKAGKGLAVEMRQRWHDKEFARSISRMPDDEWEDTGDWFEKPFVALVPHVTVVAAEDDDDYEDEEAEVEEEEKEEDEGAWDENQVCNLFFAKAREDQGFVGMAWAVTDDEGHVLVQKSKYLGAGVAAASAEYTALIDGLAYARSVGVRNLVAHGHSVAVCNQVSGAWRPHQPAHVKFLKQVKDYEKLFDSLHVCVAPKTKNRYVVNLATRAIESHVATLTKDGVQKHLSSQSTKNEVHEDCPICCERTPVAKLFIVRNCSHKFCLGCLSQHVEVQVKANQVPVRCPLDCSNRLELDQCQPFLPPKVQESYAKCLTEASIPESDRVYCPFPNCSALMSKDGLHSSDVGSSSRHPPASSIGRCECMECHRLFCVECQVPWHADLSCAAYQKLPPDGRDAEDIKLYQLANNKNWQRCKMCRRMIELDQGCYHMTCRCGHEFCYTCGAEWKNKQATCKCKLWDEDNIIQDDDFMGPEDEEDSDSEDEYDLEDRLANIHFKTRICRHWQQGYCWAGAGCAFAHGQGELRRVAHMY